MRFLQELGDFGVLLHAGYSPRRALVLNVASGAAGIVGAVVVYTAASHLPAALPYMLAFAAGGFLYVAMADLIPGLHSHHQGRHPLPPDAAHRRRHRDDAPLVPV